MIEIYLYLYQLAIGHETKGITKFLAVLVEYCYNRILLAFRVELSAGPQSGISGFPFQCFNFYLWIGFMLEIFK